MDKREKEEEQNKRVGWLTSVGVQLVLLVLFYFIIAWREPFPPIPEYGIELGFTSSAGAPASSPAPVNESEREEVVEESTENESLEESAEEVIESNDSETREQSDPAAESIPVEEEVIEDTQDTVVPIVEEDPEESEAEEETPEVDSRALMQPSETESEGEGESQSEGEEDQEVDQRAIYGSQGTNSSDAEGANLSLAGWIWDQEPRPDDQSNASGKIIFKITVDDNGELRGITTQLSTVSQSVERKYREAVEKLSFSKTSEYKTAQLSTGTITFIIKSK